jgi:uncharacterized membrane-anchored protein YhcB (DUF1043 family)
MSNQQDSSGQVWALGFGLIAGIAVGYYLNSNEGRAARRKAQVQFDEYGNQITEYGHQVSQQVTERASHLADDAKARIEEGKQWTGNTAESIKSTVTEKTTALKKGANETISSVEDSFKRGVDKAKAKVNADKA